MAPGVDIGDGVEYLGGGVKVLIGDGAGAGVGAPASGAGRICGASANAAWGWLRSSFLPKRKARLTRAAMPTTSPTMISAMELGCSAPEELSDEEAAVEVSDIPVGAVSVTSNMPPPSVTVATAVGIVRHRARVLCSV